MISGDRDVHGWKVMCVRKSGTIPLNRWSILMFPTQTTTDPSPKKEITPVAQGKDFHRMGFSSVLKFYAMWPQVADKCWPWRETSQF